MNQTVHGPVNQPASQPVNYAAKKSSKPGSKQASDQASELTSERIASQATSWEPPTHRGGLGRRRSQELILADQVNLLVVRLELAALLDLALQVVLLVEEVLPRAGVIEAIDALAGKRKN